MTRAERKAAAEFLRAALAAKGETLPQHARHVLWTVAQRLYAQVENQELPEEVRNSYLARAREIYEDEGRIEIDDDAALSYDIEGFGSYVQAWVWVDALPESEEIDA